MPRLIIDDREIEVPRGTKVIKAAELLGIMIPRFCYHWILGSVGACRLCAVKLLHKEFRGVQMSCMIDAQDGMIVSTNHPEAVAFRKRVIEWLMLNHPHDCPVCDAGGQCLLQDMTVSAAHGIRRYRGKKRTYRDQYLGSLVKHEMNRCIQCYRCSRFYQEFSGYRDLGAMQIADRVYFGRYTDGPLESPFSGNLIDICPTGVYTDKPARYNYRRWELERSPSICIHCSLLCRTVATARFRSVVRLEAPVDELDQGFFICDRGRFGFHYTDLPERPRMPRVEGKDVPWEEALAAAVERLRHIESRSGPSAVASIGSARSGLETQSALKRLCRLAHWRGPAYFPDPRTARKAGLALSNMEKPLALSMRDIEGCDLVLAVGADPINESPVLALSMRQAWRKGATVAVIDPRPVSLPFDFRHLPMPRRQLETCLGFLVRAGLEPGEAARLGGAARDFFDALPAGDSLDASVQRVLSTLASDLRKSRRPVVICGTDIVAVSTPAFAADCARLMQGARGSAGLFYVMTDPNSLGAALFSGPETFMELVEAIEAGAVKGLLVVENDPFSSYPDRERLEKAISRLDMLLVLDFLPSETVSRASVFLPAETLFETGSSFIGQDGRVRFAAPVHAGGEPIHQVSAGSHPPRRFEDRIPGGEPRPSWQALVRLGTALSVMREPPPESAGILMAEELPALGALGKSYPPEDVEWISDFEERRPFGTRPQAGDPGRAGELDLLLVDWTFGTEELASYSPVLKQIEPEPVFCLHRDDAAAAGLADRDQVLIGLDGGPLALIVKTSAEMARGTAVIPRHKRLAWQRLPNHPAVVQLGRIERVSR
jgi:NADH-quinone oxidoreductase subunit G